MLNQNTQDGTENTMEPVQSGAVPPSQPLVVGAGLPDLKEAAPGQEQAMLDAYSIALRLKLFGHVPEVRDDCEFSSRFVQLVLKRLERVLRQKVGTIFAPIEVVEAVMDEQITVVSSRIQEFRGKVA